MKEMIKQIGCLFLMFVITTAIVIIGLFSTAGKAHATAVEKIYWCHVTPSGEENTLHLPLAALQEAGHMDAQGNPLHAGDYSGECKEVENSPTPTATPTPVDDDCDEDDPCETLTPTPVIEEIVSPTPTLTPAPQVNNGGPGDGKSDGRSDGKSSCPECTAAPKQEEITFANTGATSDMIMNVVGIFGALSAFSGLFLLKK